MTTRIAIIDDHQLFREGIKRILEFDGDFEVVAEGSDGRKLFRSLKSIAQIWC